MTGQDYLFDNRLESTATIVAVKAAGEVQDDDRPSLLLSRTIFQHEGDDRLADRGWIDDLEVAHVCCSTVGDVCHHVEGSADRFRAGQSVGLRIDENWRHVTARVLCAGRLIQGIGGKLSPRLVYLGGSYKPHRAFLEFGGDWLESCSPWLPELHEEMSAAIERCIALDLPVVIRGDPRAPGTRRVRIGEYPSIPCRGVYVERLSELGTVKILRVVETGGKVQVRYRVCDPEPLIALEKSEQRADHSDQERLPTPYGLFY
jgi:Ser-tRNA(Ala) deacylase AlaX